MWYDERFTHNSVSVLIAMSGPFHINIVGIGEH